MAEINKLACASNAGNTGVGCFFDPLNIIGAILTPKGWEIDTTSLEANLIAATHNASKSARIYPIYDLETTTDATEKKTIQTMPTGQKHVVREGYNDWSFQYVEGGLSLLTELRKSNGTNFDFIFIDKNGTLIGIPGSTPAMLKAIPSTGGFFWADPFKLSDGSKITEYMVQFVFDSRYINDDVAYIVAGFDLPTTVKGLQNVVVTPKTNVTIGSYNVSALTAATKSDLGGLFPTELNVTGLWVAKNKSTGAAITITTVTYNSTLGQFVFALDTADPDYPATSALLTINLAAPAVLQAAGIDGYESTGAATLTSNGD